jgi:NAD-dependent deacetylase
MKRKIVIFTGAGVSQESGIKTFRDTGGLWDEYKIEDVASPSGWKKDKEKVLDFYNKRRTELKNVEPNKAHLLIKELENYFDISVITTNVDNLHEKAGSTNIIHLHGELTKVRSTLDPKLIYNCEDDCNIGDKCEKGSQLRPHITWFDEELPYTEYENALNLIHEADILIIIGTSMQVQPAASMPWETPENCLIYYIDPDDIGFIVPKQKRPFFTHIQEKATEGMEYVFNDVKEIFI